MFKTNAESILLCFVHCCALYIVVLCTAAPQNMDRMTNNDLILKDSVLVLRMIKEAEI